MEYSTTAMEATAAEEESSYAFILQVKQAVVLPLTLKAAIELGLLDIIARSGPAAQLSAAEIAAQLLPDATATSKASAAAAIIDRILRLLASYSVLTCSEFMAERRYGATPVVRFLAKNDENDDDASLGAMILAVHDKVFAECWNHLKDAVLEGGIPFNKTHGMSCFEYLSTDPRLNMVFNKGMKANSVILMRIVLERYDGFDGCAVGHVLVDVGGGIGATLGQIVAKHPRIKGINFDLPHVISQAPPIPGVEHIGGDMFEQIPNGDTIFLKHILHDWSDDRCLMLLKNCFKTLPEDGKVIVMEYIVPATPEATIAAQSVFCMDMTMLVLNPGGKERTLQEFESLAEAAGFTGFRALFSCAGIWIMELHK